MTDMTDNLLSTPSAGPLTLGKNSQASMSAPRVLVPLVTPYLYGMERAVIELFDSLRPEVEPYFLQSNRIFQLQLPIIREMTRRRFSVQFLPDQTHWERLAKPRSFKHLYRM